MNDWGGIKAIPNPNCVIICNGPSLRDVPNSFLQRYPTFGTNRVYLKYVPDYYVCVNPLVLNQWELDIASLPSAYKFIRMAFAHYIPNSYPLLPVAAPHFSFEPWKGIYEGYTVTFVALQLAYFMGYRTVLLVGCDHRYIFDGKPNEARVMEGDDPNHFDPNYFKGSTWNNPDLAKSEEAYRMAQAVYETDGRRIINLTPGTALDVFEKGEIWDW